MIAKLAHALDWMDGRWSRAFAERDLRSPHVLVALFHAVVRDPVAHTPLLAPELSVTADDMRRFLDAALRAGYAPVAAGDLARPGPTEVARKRLVVTFDDGYFNNTLALPVLEEFGVPAVFFISTAHVDESRSFWWDTVARLWRHRGTPDQRIRRELERLKWLAPGEIERMLAFHAGTEALRPLSDVDRPFGASELRDFARSRWVSLGNHTAQHTILTRCSDDEAERAISDGQRQLEAITGEKTDLIAYPDGAFSPAVVAAARRAGHRLGFTCEPRSNGLPLDSEGAMTLGRHAIRHGQDYSALLPRLATRTVLPGARFRAGVRAALGHLNERAPQPGLS